MPVQLRIIIVTLCMPIYYSYNIIRVRISEDALPSVTSLDSGQPMKILDLDWTTTEVCKEPLSKLRLGVGCCGPDIWNPRAEPYYLCIAVIKDSGDDLRPSHVMNTTSIELQTGLTTSSFCLAWQRPYSKSWARNLQILICWSFVWWRVLIVPFCTVNRNPCATCNPSILWVIIDHSSSWPPQHNDQIRTYSSEVNSKDVSRLFPPIASQFEEEKAEASYGQTSFRWNDVSDTELEGLFAANGYFIFIRIRLTGHI